MVGHSIDNDWNSMVLFFNIIAGYLAIPSDIKDVVNIFHLSGWRWWTHFLIPSLFPSFITAIINAAGAAWNADIAAELISWGTHQYAVTDLVLTLPKISIISLQKQLEY